MAKTKTLTWWHEITEKRIPTGTILQRLLLTVEYDRDCITPISVELFENGKYVAEISKLLDKAEGSPLNAILDAIDWDVLYAEHLVEEQENREEVAHA